MTTAFPTAAAPSFNPALAESSGSLVAACLETWVLSCEAGATVAPCWCGNTQAWINAQSSCLDGIFTPDATWYSLESSVASAQCTNPVTISPVGHIPSAAATPIGSHASATAAALKTPTVTPAPIYASVITVTSLNSTTSYSPLPTWTGVGGLLVDYCASPGFSLFQYGATALWVAVVGCNGDRPDCCPFQSVYNPNLPSTSPTGTLFTTSITVSVGPSGQISVPTSISTSPLADELATLDSCPSDYQEISGGCCPTGYGMWNGAWGAGQTPCFSTLPATTTAPPVLVSELNLATSKPTSAVVNVVYAVHYPVKRSGLSTGAKIGVGSGVGALLLIALVLVGSLIFFKRRRQPPAPTVTVADEKAAAQAAAAVAPAQELVQSAPVYTNQPPVAQPQAYAQPQQVPAYPQPPQPHGYPQFQQPQVYFQPQQLPEYQQASHAPVVPAGLAGGQITSGVYPYATQMLPQAAGAPNLYQQAPQISPASTTPSPVQPLRELHDPHWAGRHELQSQ